MVAEKIINYRLETIPQAYEKIEAWVKQSVVYGTSLIKVIWKFATVEKQDEKKDKKGNVISEPYSVPAVDAPDLEVPNILDCFYNPIISDVNCQPSIIFRSVLPIEEVMENTAYDYKGTNGLNREQVKSKGSKLTSVYDSSNQLNSESINVISASEGTVEVYERITDDRIQTVADGEKQLLLRDVSWDYESKCTVKLTHEPMDIPNRFNGLGVGHNTLGLSRLIQKLSNKLQDAVNLGNNPHFLGRKGSGVDKKQLIIMPGGLTEVDGEGSLQDQIVPLNVPDIKNGALSLLDRFDDDHKRAS